MVTITMSQLLDFENNGDFIADVNLPLKGAYKINKIRKNTAKEVESYREKFREIIDKYAKKDENGNLIFSDDNSQIMIQEDKIDECEKALTELQDLTVEVDNYNLTLEDLGEDFECSPDEIDVLMPFFN